jgi:hypothetical protein
MDKEQFYIKTEMGMIPVQGHGFEFDGEDYFFWTDNSRQKHITHKVTGRKVCGMKGRGTVRNAKETIQNLIARLPEGRFASVIDMAKQQHGAEEIAKATHAGD